MTQRENNLICLRDTLEQLVARRQQLEWTTERDSVREITEAMIRDLDNCRRLCEALRPKPKSRAS
jgi:hypothetical protein